MDAVLKKGLGLVVVAFLLWFLFTDPNGLANASKSIGTGIWHALESLFSAVSQFMRSITR